MFHEIQDYLQVDPLFKYDLNDTSYLKRETKNPYSELSLHFDPIDLHFVEQGFLGSVNCSGLNVETEVELSFPHSRTIHLCFL